MEQDVVLAPIQALHQPLARRRLNKRGTLVRVMSLLGTLVLWEWFGRGVNPIFFSYPTAVAKAVPAMIVTGELPRAAVISLKSMSTGYALALVLGIALGLLIGRYRIVYYIFDLQLTAIYATPYVALIPLFVLWFGLGMAAKVAIVFLTSFFPIVINTADGVRNVSQSLIDVARAEQANDWQIFTKIVIPASIPNIMTGVRLSIGRAVVGVTVAEMFTAITGLGGSIVYYGNQFRTDKLLVVIILLAMTATLLTEGARWVERRVAAWKETERAA